MTVRPWVWIFLLFLGPTAGTFAFQWYIYTVVSSDTLDAPDHE